MHRAIPVGIGIGGLIVADQLYVKPSPHFTWQELMTTSSGYANTPDFAARINLWCLCRFVLERIRSHFGDKPVHVNSAYRTQQVNSSAGGEKNSEHMKGKAADIYISGVDMVDIATWLYDTRELPIGQCIIEWSDNHLHVSVDTEHLFDPQNARHDYRYTYDEDNYPSWQPGMVT